MKKCLFVLMFCCFAVLAFLIPAFSAGMGGPTSSAGKQAVQKDAKTFAVENIIWHGQSAIEVHDGLSIFCDPYKLSSLKNHSNELIPNPPKADEGSKISPVGRNDNKADLILITHPHPDHLSPEDIKKIQASDTVIVAPDDPDCRKKLTGDVRYMKPGETIIVKGIVIEAVPSYNTGFIKFHKRSYNWLGYIFTVDGLRIYTAGDTDRIPEMKQMKVDIAFLPVGGGPAMGPADAVEAALDINPKVVLPMHYGLIPFSSGNGEKFKQLMGNKLEVLVKQKE
jgi:L-ascorbate metabolism protein UlaG (beta-lactamase superfamily)